MSVSNCPLPEVAEALRPYIKPRDEVAAIRQDLHLHLYNELANAGPRLSAVTSYEQELGPASQQPSALTGVRKAYWKALQAHTAAQAKYDALKADLQQLRSPAGQESPAKLSAEAVNDSFLPLLRLRETQRKLQAVDHAFSEISSTGNVSSSNSVEGVVRRRNGDPPAAPPAEVAPYRQGPDVEARILQLKKAVLSAKRRVDEYAEGGLDSAQERPSSRAGEVAGLQSALNKLTGWMETQLALIGNAEADAHPPSGMPDARGGASPEAASLENVADLYDRYLTARENLIYTVNNPTSLDVSNPAVLFASSSRVAISKDANKRKAPSELLLPYISSFTAAKQDEQVLLQQSTYLRRQIAAAEGETDRLIARLADESHLVHPGAASGKDWAKAATVAGAETETFVRQRLQSGEKFASTAALSLEDIGAVTRSMDILMDE